MALRSRRNSSPAAFRGKVSPTKKNKDNGKLKRRASTNSLPVKRKLNALQNPLTLKLKIGKLLFTSVKTPIHMLESREPGAYEASFWRNDKGPAIFLNNLKNSSKTIVEEIKNDFDQIRKDTGIYKKDQDDLPIYIYIKPGKEMELGELIDALNDQFTSRDNRRYVQVRDDKDPSLIHLRLQVPAPLPLTAQDLSYDDDLDSEDIIIQREDYNYDDDLDSEDIIIQPKPKPVPPKSLLPLPKRNVVDNITFIKNMGTPPKEKEGSSELYKTLIRRLSTYNQLMDNIADQNGKELTKEEFENQARNIKEKKESLEEAISNYEQGNSKVLFKRKNAKKVAIDNLKKALNDDNVGGENSTLDIIKKNGFINKHSPLRDSNIDTTQQGRVLGEGAQGQVRSIFVKLPDGSTIEGGRKFDNEEASEAAFPLGIPKDNPQEAKRSVATYEGSRFLGLNNVPATYLIHGKNPKTGEDGIGQVIERVNGIDGQKKMFVRDPKTKEKLPPLDKDSAAYYIELRNRYKLDPKSLDSGEIQQLAGKIFVGIEPNTLVFNAVTTVLDVNYADPIIQKGLSDQQLLDIFVGHTDRHPGNWMYETDSLGRIIGVVAIDNDDTWAKNWSERNYREGSKTPGVPPIVDVHSAIKILQVDSQDIPDSIKSKLTPEELDAAIVRLEGLQAEIRNRIRNEAIAKMPETVLSERDKQFLLNQANLSKSESLDSLKEWGLDTILEHFPSPTTKPRPDVKDVGESNSYLGDVLRIKALKGKAPLIDN